MNSGVEAKITVGKVTVDVGQVIRNVTGVETDEEKKSLLQKILEPETVDGGERDAKKAQKIARKIARGEAVTPQEKAFLIKFDPKLAQMAELAHQQGERVKHALQNASSREEQHNIIQQAYQMVAQVSKKNPQFGELLGEAVKAAVQDSRKKGLFQEEEMDGVSRDNLMEKEQDEQQTLLEQFFPEEDASLMDCRG